MVFDENGEEYYGIDFEKHPEKYKIGGGEQGVLTAQPYKSRILPHWKFKTPAEAKESSQKIYSMFLEYLKKDDFVGADLARSALIFLKMWKKARLNEDYIKLREEFKLKYGKETQ